MIKREIQNFDLYQICRSGQCFRMTAMDDGRVRILAGNRFLEAERGGREGEWLFSCGDEEFEMFWASYFDLEQDYGRWIASINPNDRYLSAAAAFGSGIRILRQDLWEMIVSFLISQQNNIARIRRCIENICEAYGEPMADESGINWYAFPTPEVLADLDEDALKACNLGYRSKYVVRAARSVRDHEIDPEAIPLMNYRQSREELLKLFGVGEKVADCICLFSLHHLQAFPVDTHIRQAMEAHYKRGFPNRRYRGFQGVLQQYIFYYELFGKESGQQKEGSSGAGARQKEERSHDGQI